MSINSSVVTEEIISPYFFKKLVSGKSYVLVLYKVEQQVVFLWGKVCLFAVYENISCGEVYLKSFKLYGSPAGSFPDLLRFIIAFMRARTSLGENGFTT